MSTNYIDSVWDTMALVRRMATHLAAEPNFPDTHNLTRGEVDAWIRALDTGITPRAVDFLSVLVLEALLHMRGTRLWNNRRCLRRVAGHEFDIVVASAWDRNGASDVDYSVWQYEEDRSTARLSVGDGVEAMQEDDPQNPVEDEEMTDAIQDGATEDVNHLIEQDVMAQDVGGQEPTEQVATGDETNEEGATQDVPTQNGINQEVTGSQDANNDSLPSTTDESDDDDYPDRELWCHCNGPQDDRAMVECNNHKDIDCNGKWFHAACVNLPRVPPENVDWYCEDCRKKLSRGLYTNGLIH